MSACTHCQLCRPAPTMKPPIKPWPTGTVVCGHKASTDTLAVIRARIPEHVFRSVVLSMHEPRLLLPEDQPAMCPVRVPPHAATPEARS